MKKIFAAIFFIGFVLELFAASGIFPRTTENFDANWKFFKGDAAGAEDSGFDDRNWPTLNLPHDWSIEGPFSETNKTGGAGGFLPSGIAWYRKHFSLPTGEPARRVFIEFDGVMANSDVWINGFHLGHRPNGYVSFSYEITGHLNFDGDNVIAIRCDTSQQPASRWYAGAGIYRHVRLVVTEPVHFLQNGIFISTPKVSTTQATVHVECTVTNESKSSSEIFVQVVLLDPDGKILDFAHAGLAASISQTLAVGKSAKIDQDVVVENPRLWNLDKPVLYRAQVTLYNGVNRALNLPASSAVQTLDNETNFFGIRDAHFDAATGFWLNGKNFKIKGVCLHADGGAFGAAIPLSIWEARLKTLKSLGVNAIRTAHNPPAPEFLDLCDRMGFLVMDEFFDCWTVGKNPFDYHLYFNEWSQRDERDTILRDRNHPSIIIYSVGNEIHDTPHADLAKKILAGLIQVAHETDPTRPVTMALFRPNVSHDYDDGLADMLDVIGQNYRENEILAAHAQKPSRKIIGTENQHSRAAWLALRDNPPYAGQFLWSGIDYLGESRRWPVIGAGSGLLDRTGAPKPMAFERQSWWSDTPMVFIARRSSPAALSPSDPGYEPPSQDVLRRPQVLFHDWTPKNFSSHDENVEIYSNCKEVELFLNDKSLGAKEINADASPRNWNVPFAPGILKAVARGENGKIVATDELKTAGAPAKIILTTETKKLSPGFDRLAIVRAKITDANGIEIPRANDLISFHISGPGKIVAVDNGDNASHESFQASERRAFQGECVAYVRATGTRGKIILTATAIGLKAGSISIQTK